MKISILSVFPKLYDEFLKTSLIARAQEKKIVSFDLQDYFSFVQPKKRIDGSTFGPGSGMLIKPEVVQQAIESQTQKYGKPFTIFFSPQGKKLTQPLLRTLAQTILEKEHLLFVTSRYEGMDARVEKKYADLVLSIGDYVLMGGDLPAMVFMEGLFRLFPGVVGKQESIIDESFTGPFFDYPEYTQPVTWQGMQVPEIVRSGNHNAISQWRDQQAAKNTVMYNFQWVKTHAKTDYQKNLAAQYIPPHYMCLMHTEVYVGDKEPGNTSVTSLDMHDIARSSRTYGIKNYFLVTPLQDQRKIIKTLLAFWQKGAGIEYNKSRHEAVNRVRVSESFAEVVAAIEEKEGKKPIILGTSARVGDSKQLLSFFDQQKVFNKERPVLIVLGTGQGLTDEFLQQCDYILSPIEGFSDYNHLSVRSAGAVILDRWLGINLKSG